MALETLITRRPVVDRRQHVFGYELLYAPSSADPARVDVALASQRLVDGLLTMGLTAVTGGRKAIVHAPRDLLVSGALTLLPSASTVVALLDDVAPDAEVVDACDALLRAGLTLGLHGHREGDPRDALLARAVMAWVDAGTDPHLTRHVTRLRERGVIVVADGVEDHDEFERAAAAGCKLFAGGLLSRPVVVEGRQVEGIVRTHARLLAAANAPEPDYDLLEELIKADVALSYKLLKYLNAAAFGWQQRITSIRHGLVLLGRDNVRRWVTLAALAGMASTKPPELVVTSVVRARFCESLGAAAGIGERALDLFSVGMFSMIDAILDLPLDVALAGVPLSDDASAALHGTPNDLRAVLDAVLAYERAQWDRLHDAAGRLGVDVVAVPRHYLAAVAWADSVLRDSTTAA